MKQECVIYDRAEAKGKQDTKETEDKILKCMSLNLCDGSVCIYSEYHKRDEQEEIKAIRTFLKTQTKQKTGHTWD